MVVDGEEFMLLRRGLSLPRELVDENEEEVEVVWSVPLEVVEPVRCVEGNNPTSYSSHQQMSINAEERNEP